MVKHHEQPKRPARHPHHPNRHGGGGGDFGGGHGGGGGGGTVIESCPRPSPESIKVSAGNPEFISSSV